MSLRSEYISIRRVLDNSVFSIAHPEPSASRADPSTFPARTLNGAKLDLFGLYRSVASRGGFPTRETRAKLNWTKDVFPDLNNYTENHRATSAGHDLIGHYQNYLLEYEEAHPDDITTRHTEVDERAEVAADGRREAVHPLPRSLAQADGRQVERLQRRVD